MKAPAGCLLGILLPIIGIAGLIIFVPLAIKNSKSDDLVFFTGGVTRFDCYEKNGELAYCHLWINSNGKTFRFKVLGDKFNESKFEKEIDSKSDVSVGILREDYEKLDTTKSTNYTPYEIKSGSKFYLTSEETRDTVSFRLMIAISFMTAMIILGPFLLYRSLRTGVSEE